MMIYYSEFYVVLEMMLKSLKMDFLISDVPCLLSFLLLKIIFMKTLTLL